MRHSPSVISVLLLTVVACSAPAKPEASLPATTSSATEAPATAPPSSSASAPAASAASTATAADDVAGKIKVVSPTERELPEDARAAVVDELARALSKAREDAKNPSLHIFGVRQDSLLGKLGIENGDRFEALDDRALAAEPDAREAFAQAKQKKRFSLKVLRRGATLTLVYTFH